MFLDQGRVPTTARALMRSRYTAYVRMDAAYLLSTWHPSTRPLQLQFEAEENVTWQGLRLIGTDRGEEDDLEGEVEFVAYFRQGNEERCMGEKSRFVREQARWLYVDGVAIPCGRPEASDKRGRNSPCPCGSGRKFKRCCGRGRAR